MVLSETRPNPVISSVVITPLQRSVDAIKIKGIKVKTSNEKEKSRDINQSIVGTMQQNTL